MKLADALHHVGLEWPRGHKLRCPYHPDKTPSLHLYDRTDSWTCFACGRNGDAYGLIAAINGEAVEDVLRRLKPRDAQTPSIQPAKTYLLKEKLRAEVAVATQPLFHAIRNSRNIEDWQRDILLKDASDWMDGKNATLRELAPYELEKALANLAAEVQGRILGLDL